MNQVAPGIQEMNDLQAAGFTNTEIDEWRTNTTRELQDAGFSTDEVQGYFGEADPDMTATKQMFEQNIDKHVATQAEKQPAGNLNPNPEMRQATGFLDAIEAGFDMSVTGLLRQRPDVVLPEHAPMYMRIASQVSQLAGDLPAMVAGGVAGGAAGTAVGGAAGSVVPVVGNVAGAAAGGVVGAGAGAFALPEGMRTVLMQHYEKGDVKDFADFWERASAVAINSGKAALIGGATAGVGGVAGKVAVGVAAPAAIQTTARLTAEVATMTTVGAALEGHAPQPQDFIDAAILVGGMHGAMKVASKTRGIYAKTGVKPEEVAAKAKEDPAFKQQLLSDNNSVAIGGEMGAREPVTPPENFPVSKPIKETNAELSPEVNTILSKVGTVGERQKKSMTTGQLYTAFVDKLDPINQATKTLIENKEVLPAEKNPYILSRVAVDYKAKAKHFFEKGVIDYNTKKNIGGSLSDALKGVESVETLEAYMISKRALEKNAQGIKTGFDLEAAQKVVEQNAEKYEAHAEKVTEFSNNVLNYVRDAGIISEKQHANFMESNKDYVPFKRIMEDAEGNPKAGGKNGSLKQMTGSERDIQSPLLSIVENTVELVRMAEVNRPKKALVELAAKTEGQEIIKRVPDRMKPIEVKAEEIVRALEDQGAITTLESIKRDLKEKGLPVTDEMIAKSFENENVFQSEAIKDMIIFRKEARDLTPNQFAVMEKGKRVVYETTPELAEAISKLGGDAPATNLAFKIANGITRFKKFGITFTPEFIVKNQIRDWITGSTFSKGTKGISPFDVIGAMKDIWTKNDHYYDWLKSGGANGAFLEMTDAYIKKDIVKLQKETNFLNSVKNVVQKPVEVMRVAAELSEQSLRVAEFKKVRKQGGSLTTAGFASREITVDFQRVGAKMSALNSITAFMNVSIQGLDRTARAFKEDPTGTAGKAAVFITTPSILLWWANKDDERVKEIPRWEKDNFWIIATDNWQQTTAEEADGLPDYMVKTDGDKVFVNKGTIYRIPKPQELGYVFGSIPERILEKYFAENPNAMKEFDKSMLNLVTPNFVPDAVAPAIEQYFNQSFFTGRDIVPHHLKDIQPEYQFVEYTSETAKAVGKMVATMDRDSQFASPLIIQNYIQSWGGTLGQYAIQVMDKGLAKSGVVPDIPKPADTLSDVPFVKAFVVRFPQAGTNSVQDFYDNFDKTEKTAKTIRYLAKQGDFDNMEKELALDANQQNMVDLGGIKDGLAAQAQMIRMIAKDPDMKPDEKRQMIDGLYLQMTETAKAGNQMMIEIKNSLGEANGNINDGQ